MKKYNKISREKWNQLKHIADILDNAYKEINAGASLIIAKKDTK